MVKTSKKTSRVIVSIACVVALFVMLGVFSAGVYAAGHTHNWKYKFVGGSVTVTCQDTDCGESVTLTLSAPVNLQYDGSEKAVVINNYDETMSCDINYFDENGDPLESAPIKVGTYSVTVSFAPGVYLSTSYTITPASIAQSDVETTLGQVIAPKAGKTPTTTISGRTGYTAEISWLPAATTFNYETVYTATVTLTAQEGYKFGAFSGSEWTKTSESTDTTWILTRAFPDTGKEKISLANGVQNNTVFIKYGETWADADFSKATVLAPDEQSVAGNWQFKVENLSDRPTAEGEYLAVFTPSDADKYAVLEYKMSMKFIAVAPTVNIALERNEGSYYPTQEAVIVVTACNPNVTGWNVPASRISLSYQVEGSNIQEINESSFDIPANADGKQITITATIAAGNGYVGVTKTFTFTVQNRQDVTHTANDPTIGYQSSYGASGSGYDVSELFNIDPNAGAATYTLLTEGTASATLNGTVLTITSTGTIIVKLTTAETATHKTGEATATLTVTKGTGSVSVSIDGWTYGESAKSPTVTSTTHTLESATYSYSGNTNAGTTYSSTDAPTAAGTYTVTVTLPANDLYEACSGNATFTIEKATPVLGTISAVGNIYLSTSPASVNLTHTGTITGTFALADGTQFSVGVGSYTYTFTPTGEYAYNYTSTSGTVELTVLSDVVESISCEGSLRQTTYTHGDMLNPDGLIFTVRYASGESDTIDNSLLTMPTLSAGQTEAVVSYGDATVTVTGLTVYKKDVTISGVSEATGLVYSKSPLQGYIGTPTCSDYSGYYDVTYTGRNSTSYAASTTPPIDAGDYTVTISIPEDADYFSGSVSVNFTIGKATLTLTVDDVDLYVSQSVPTIYTYTLTGLYDGDSLVSEPTITPTTTVNTNAPGSYTLSASGADAGSNYTVEYQDGTLSVGYARGSGSVTIEGWTYGDEPNQPRYSSDTNGTDNVTIRYEGTTNQGGSYSSATSPTLAGTYTVTATFPAKGQYEGYTTDPVAFTVAKAVPTYTTPSEFQAKFGDRLSQLTLTAGFAWQDGQGETVGNAGVNTFYVTYTPDDQYNYQIVTDIPVSVSVSKLDISNATLHTGTNLTYNGKNQTYDFRIDSINGQTVTYSVTGNTGTDVDDYELVIQGTGNFTGTLETTWSILKLTVTDENVAVVLGDALIYNGSEQIQTLASVKVNGLDVAYTVISGDRATAVGIYYMTIQAGGNFDGTAQIRWTIAPNTSKIDHLTPDNVTSADEDNIREVLDSIQSDEAKEEWKDVVDKCESLLETISQATGSIRGVLDALDRYTIETIKSYHQETIEQIEKEIDELLTKPNLTDDEKTSLEAGAAKADALLERIAEVASKMEDILDRLSKYDIDTVKSTDRVAIEAIMSDVQGLLDGQNLTSTERTKMQDAKTSCEKLLQRIQDAYNQVNTENIVKAKSLNEENLTLNDRTNVEKAIEDLTTATTLYPGNYTSEERKAIDDELARLKKLLDRVEELEDRAKIENAIKNLLDLLDQYTIETVKSSDKSDIEQIREDIKSMMKQSDVTDDDLATLQAGVIKANALLNRIADVAAQMEYILAALEAFGIDTIKSPDKARIENILKDIQDLLDGQNLTPTERADMENAKAFANALLQRIADAYNQANTENIVASGTINASNLAISDRNTLESALSDLNAAITKYPGNYTYAERATIDSEIARITSLLEQLEKMEAVQDKIDRLPEQANPGDQEAQDAYEDAKNAYDDLTDSEKKQIDTKKLDDLADMLGTYRIVEGADGKWVSTDEVGLTFVANGPMDRFTEVRIDGVSVNSTQYTAGAPQTTIVLSVDCLKSLESGAHTFTVCYADGEASCTFTSEIVESASWMWVFVVILILLVVVGGAFIFFFIYKKKEEKAATEKSNA